MFLGLGVRPCQAWTSHCVDQAGLALRDVPASASPVLGLVTY